MAIAFTQERVTIEQLGCYIIQRKFISDDRGRLTEIYRQDDDHKRALIKQVYMTTCLPGVIKAWHHHKKQTDHFFCIKGYLKVGLARFETNDIILYSYITLSEFEPQVLVIPPNVLHGFTAVGTKEALVLNCVDNLYDKSAPDEYRLSPYNFEFEERESIWKSRNA